MAPSSTRPPRASASRSEPCFLRAVIERVTMLPRSIPVKRGYVSSRLPMRYARAVKRSPRIELPSTRDDELPLRSLVATALVCLALGLGAAYGLADREAPRAAVPSEPREL